MRFVSSDFRIPDGTAKGEHDFDTQRAATLPSSIRACRELSSPDSLETSDFSDVIEMATRRPKCTCWTHKTVCLVGELKRFRLHGDDDVTKDAQSEGTVPVCNCGEVCEVHGSSKPCDAAVLVDNIEFELEGATLDESTTDDGAEAKLFITVCSSFHYLRVLN